MEIFLDLKIREQVARYLDDDITLAQFQEWFAPVLWDIESRANKAAIELAYEIELLLAELSQHHRTEAEFRELLAPLVTTYEVSLDLTEQVDFIPACLAETSSSAKTTVTEFSPGQSRPGGIRHAAAPV